MDLSLVSFQNEITIKTTLFFVVEAFLGVVFLSSLKFRTLKQVISGLRRFGRRQEGAGYSTSFIIILPIYVFIIAFTFEFMSTLLAKTGTVHMSLMAARAAIVHLAVERPSDRPTDFIPKIAQEKARKAAVIAATSTVAGGFDPAVKKSASSKEAREYLQAYRDYVALAGIKSPVSEAYILKKYASAEKRTDVKLTLSRTNGSSPNEPWKQSLTATIIYDMPFRLPFIGRCIGGKSKDGAVVKTIISQTTLGVECPQNDSGYLGAALPWREN